ncbi:MAG: TldD/PmbA family protein [Bacteroidota bacterium]
MDYQILVQQLADRAIKAGADEADVYLRVGREFEVTIRAGQIELLKQAQAKGVGVRVFTEKRMAFSHTTDFSDHTLGELVDNTVRMARHATQDHFHGLPEQVTKPVESRLNQLDLVDPGFDNLSTEQKIALAREMEQAALRYDKRVKLVEGASFSDSAAEVFLANSRGFSGTYAGTGSSLVCSVIAEENGNKEANYWYSSKRFFSDHQSPESIGTRAAERAVKMLNARTVPSGKYPVVFDPLLAASFLGFIAAALNGETVFRKMSFLTEKLGERIGSDLLTIIDDGTMPRGFGSKPFDGEGMPTRRKVVVEKGILKSYLYDSCTARKARTESTGNAARGTSSTPRISPLNFYVEAGQHSPEEIIRSVAGGFYVTNMIGFGVDTVTGQFSRGASGYWIKNGERAFPVHQVTVASNMLEMLQNVEMVGDDLNFLGSIASPTLKIREMTVSGR